MTEHEKIEQPPQIKPLWIVLDGEGYPIYCASYAEACHEHINDAINEFNIYEAVDWKVIEAFAKTHAQQNREPVAGKYFFVDDALHKCDKDYENSDEVFSVYTQPPATVPLEEYNKLLEALKTLVELKHQKDTLGKVPTYMDAMPIAWNNARQAIAEAEEKDR